MLRQRAGAAAKRTRRHIVWVILFSQVHRQRPFRIPSNLPQVAITAAPQLLFCFEQIEPGCEPLFVCSGLMLSHVFFLSFDRFCNSTHSLFLFPVCWQSKNPVTVLGRAFVPQMLHVRFQSACDAVGIASRQRCDDRNEPAPANRRNSKCSDGTFSFATCITLIEMVSV